MKKIGKFLLIFACAWVTLSMAAMSAQSAPIVYPAKGQSEDQQNKDEGECRQWAVNKTGVDPAVLAAQTTSGEVYQRDHTALGGAARGAVGGLLVGAIAGDAGKGAAIGAGAGAVGGGIRGRRDLNRQQEVASNARADQQAQLQQYDRAYVACLTGKGYSVK